MKNAIKFGFGFTIGGMLAITTYKVFETFCGAILMKISEKSVTKVDTTQEFNEWLKANKPEQYEAFKKHGLI